MKTIFVCALVSFLVLLHGCGGDKPTEPDEDSLDFSSVEFAPLLNTQVGREFAESPLRRLL